MRLSQFHLHTERETPAEAEVASHRLMLRAGMIRRLAAGLYTWSPLGLRVLRKVEAVVREEMDRAGALEMAMPSVQRYGDGPRAVLDDMLAELTDPIVRRRLDVHDPNDPMLAALMQGEPFADGTPKLAGGLDRPYPRQHTELWRWVAEAGVLVSEWPPGSRPEPWRFPLRNRVIAALAEVTVVVESREKGGSLITAREAAQRGVPVMAVPGSLQTLAAKGVNALIRDGAHPLTALDDVLVLLGFHHSGQARLPIDTRRPPTAFQQRVLDRCSHAPCTVDMLVDALDCPIADAALAAAKLVHDRWLVEAGGWFEPAGSLLGHW